MTNPPPLLMIAEGRRPRPRRCPLSNPREIVLHKAVVDVLRKFGRPEWRWTHIPTGEKRDIRTAAKLKSMGAKPGWPDLILVSPKGRFHALELKRAGEELSEDQEGFKVWCIGWGIPHSVAWTLDEAITVLDAWGALRVRFGGAA